MSRRKAPARPAATGGFGFGPFAAYGAAFAYTAAEEDRLAWKAEKLRQPGGMTEAERAEDAAWKARNAAHLDKG